MKAIEMIQQRRSIRNYKQEKVSRQTLTEIVDLARWSPSWANTQIARYTIIDNRELMDKIHDQGVNGFSYNMNTIKKAQGLVILSFVQGKSGKLGDKTQGLEDESSKWEMFDAGIACQTFCLAAHAKGVGTCIFGVIDSKAIAEIISLPSQETVACLITYGYEQGEHPTAPTRKTTEEIIRFK